jgi:hypothetical protein
LAGFCGRLAEGYIETVGRRLLDSLLLNEVQRQDAEIRRCKSVSRNPAE